mgnify:CR=1 FL=1
MIKALIFDFDYTLSNRSIALYPMLKDIIKKYLPNLDEIEKEAVVQKLMFLDEFGTKSRKSSIEYLASTYQLDIDELQEEFSDLSLRMAPLTVLDDEAIPLLEYLKKETDYKLAILTNGYYESQKLKIDSTGIAKYFDHIIMSAETGYQKPDKRAFDYAIDKLKLKPEECLYIGDVFFNDILGAYRAGMKYVLVNNFRKWHYMDGIDVIDHLSMLKEVLKKYEE